MPAASSALMGGILASPSLPSFNAGRPNLRPDLVPPAFARSIPAARARGSWQAQTQIARAAPAAKIDLLAGRVEGRVDLRALLPDRHAFRQTGPLVFLT